MTPSSVEWMGRVKSTSAPRKSSSVSNRNNKSSVKKKHTHSTMSTHRFALIDYYLTLVGHTRTLGLAQRAHADFRERSGHADLERLGDS